MFVARLPKPGKTSVLDVVDVTFEIADGGKIDICLNPS
jgi:hypothetical protein